MFCLQREEKGTKKKSYKWINVIKIDIELLIFNL